MHKLIVAFFTLTEDNRLLQAVFLDAGDQVAVVAPGGILDIGAGKGLDIRQLDEPQFGVLLRLRGLLFPAGLGGAVSGGFLLLAILGRLRGLLFLAGLSGAVSGGFLLFAILA